MRSYSSNVTDVDQLVQLLPGWAQVEFWLLPPKQFLFISYPTNRCRLKQREAADAAPLNSWLAPRVWEVSLMPGSRSRKVGSRSANAQTHGKTCLRVPLPPLWVLGEAALHTHVGSVPFKPACVHDNCANRHQLITHLMKTSKHKRKPKRALSVLHRSDFVSTHFYRKALFFKKNCLHLDPAALFCWVWTAINVTVINNQVQNSSFEFRCVTAIQIYNVINQRIIIIQLFYWKCAIKAWKSLHASVPKSAKSAQSFQKLEHKPHK